MIENLMGLNKTTKVELAESRKRVQRLAEVIIKQGLKISLLRSERDAWKEAAYIYREATLVSHDAHWRSGSRGGCCPACVWIDSLRDKADEILGDL